MHKKTLEEKKHHTVQTEETLVPCNLRILQPRHTINVDILLWK